MPEERGSQILFLSLKVLGDALDSDDFLVEFSEFVAELLAGCFGISGGSVKLVVVEDSGSTEQELIDLRLRN